MAAPNPYLIYVELFWPDGSRPNQNQIARVRAFDVNGSTVTDEGQSGFNSATGGWLPVYMQNIAAFSPPRDQPNLRFDVMSTSEAVVHSTQVFANIPSGSTVRITIGVGAELVGGSGSSWKVSGKVRRSSGTAFGPGTVIALDVTNGSSAQLGTSALNVDGSYSISYPQSSFSSNGLPHAQPNLLVKAVDSLGQVVAQSSLIAAAGTNQVVDLTLADDTPQPVLWRVFGTIGNGLRLPVDGVSVQAFHLAWTASGLTEVALGTKQSGPAGAYEILYSPPPADASPIGCSTPAGQVNLIVYAKDAASPNAVLATSSVFFDVAREQRVDLTVDRVAVTTDSEYSRVHAALSNCLGSTDSARRAALLQLKARPEYLAFVAKASEQPEALVRAYMNAWLIAYEINEKVPVPPLSRPMSAEVIYALLRGIDASSLTDLLNIEPPAFFEAIVTAVRAGIVAASLENDLLPSAAFGNLSLLDDWRTVLKRLMSQSSTWQSPLLNLVFPDTTAFPEVASATGTAFATDTTAHNVPLPSGIVAGDLLVILFVNDGSATVTPPSGWTPLFATTSSGDPCRLTGLFKVAVGGESGNVNVQTSSAEQAAAQVYRIPKASWNGVLTGDGGVAVSTSLVGASTTINPALFSPSGFPPTKVLWLAAAAHDGAPNLTASPANYTPSPALRTPSSASAGNCTMLSCRRQTEAASEDPGAFVLASAEDWVTSTIGVRGAPISLATKREAVAGAHFDAQGSFVDAITSLRAAGTLTEIEAENVTFVFEMYERVSRYYPIVAAVYAQKLARGWKTIKDLGTVPLEGGSGNDWATYAASQQSYSNGNFPDDVPGATTAERIRVYAARLRDLFGATGSQERFTNELGGAAASHPAFTPVLTFLAANPTFDLESSNVERYLAEHAVALPAEQVKTLKQVQRVYRIAPNATAAVALVDAGLDSAVKIARLDEGQFVANYEQALGGLTVARDVYRTAAHYSSEVLFTLVKFHQNLNAVGGLVAVPGAVNVAGIPPSHGLLPAGAITSGGAADTRRFPNWVTLFGSLNQCACPDCQTVLSPGAYLVDLLELVEGAPKQALLQRRADLADIELTCANTNTVLPYIDLVNEVLEAVVEPLAFVLPALSPNVPTVFDGATDGVASHLTTVKSTLATRGYTLGVNARIRRGAADKPSATPVYREWAIEDEAWRFSVRQTGASFTVYPAPQTSANDSLEVFPEHFNVPAYDKLRGAVFPFNLPLDLGREETEVFLSPRNTSLYAILEAFRTDDFAAAVQDPRVALAYLRLTSAEATAMVGAVTTQRELWGFNADTATIARPDQPTLTVTGNWVQLLQLVPVFLHRSGLRYTELLELLDARFVHVQAADAHGLHLAAPADALPDCDYNRFQIAHLNADTLTRISFFVRAWRKLGWSMRDVDAWLMGFEGGAIPVPSAAGAPVGSRFVRLFQLKRLVDELKLPPRAVMAFFRTIDTRRSDRHVKSWFDETFLDGSPAQAEIRALEPVAQGGTLALDGRPPEEDVRGHVRAALRLKGEDFDAAFARVVGSGAGLTLDLGKLTVLYRLATLSRALQLSIEEYFDLAALTGAAPLPESVESAAGIGATLVAAHTSLEQWRTARATKLPAAELRYYLSNEHEVDDPFAPTDAGVEAAVQRLASAATELAAQNPEQPNPDGAALSAALGKLMPADKLVLALQLVEAPDATDAKQLAFVERYFAVFSRQTPAAFLGSLAFPALPAAEQRAARYQAVWNSVHGYLVEQARTSAALTVAAELANTDVETANVLLTQSLSNLLPHAGAAPNALEDWKTMLRGGWDTGEVELVDAGPATRHAVFVVPGAGEYRFVASVQGTTGDVGTVALTLEIDGVPVALPASGAVPRAGRREMTFGPLSLKANAAHAITFVRTGAAPVSLLLRVDNADAIVLPSSALVPFNEDVYNKWFKAAHLARALRLSKVELRYVVEHQAVPGALSLDALPITDAAPDVPWATLSRLLETLTLNRSVPLKAGSLFELWRDTLPPLTEADALTAVSVQTGWKEADISALRELWPAGTRPAYTAFELWRLLARAFVLLRRLDIPARQVIDRLVTAEPSIGSASALRNLFRTQFSRDAWKETFKPLRDVLRQRQRDALVGYLTTRPLPVGPNGALVDFFDSNDLFSHFLIDVAMEPDTLISRIKLALNVVQLFVERVFLGLEDSRSLGQLEAKKDQWKWMDRYRVWEANRKVFLYPENWIEPELRDDKTELFAELEDELLQQPITHETGVTAVTNYLEKLSELSNLEVVGSYTEGTFASGTNYVVHVIGRTRSRPRSYFYRTFEAKQAHDGNWNPWQKVSLEIDADVVAPVVVDGRLRLYWPKVQTKEKPKPYDTSEGDVTGANVAKADRTEYQAEIRVLWSELVAKTHKWTKPKLSKSRLMDLDAPTPFQREVGEDEARTENYHIRVQLESGNVALDVYRTDVPTSATEIEFRATTYDFGFFKFTLKLPAVVASTLSPLLLGTFHFWPSGEDLATDSHSNSALGTNYPVGTVLKSNAAVEVSYAIDSKVANDSLQFIGNVPFFSRTPDTFRIFSSNFGFAGKAGKEPFFYETVDKSLFALDKPTPRATSLSQRTVLSAGFSTFHHPLAQTFEERLHEFGMSGLMNRLTEALPLVDDRYYSNYYYNYYGNLYLGYHIAGDSRAWYTTQRLFEGEHGPNALSVAQPYPLPTVEFGYGTSFGVYNWELFFHLPMLVGARLSQDLKFEEAMKWYHYVFDPKQDLNTYERTKRWASTLPAGARYWTFLPFFANRDTTDTLLDTLGLTQTLSQYEKNQLAALIDEWRNNPFKPHLIARHRISAYQKFVVMKYLDNLIAWADQLFRQDTFETINQATQLYILADELLGKRPQDAEPLTTTPRLTYRELQAKGIDEFSNAIVEVESLMVTNRPHLKAATLPRSVSATVALRSIALRSFYFKVPRNERLDGYWDTVQDRLFKIRNSMNIDGVKRRLALFEPPIDPALLVRAAAAGLDLGSVLAQLATPLPCYRFNVWLGKANELVNELKGFGAALLAALEKKDSEELQRLRQNHEIKLLQLVRRVKQQQVTEAEGNIKSLELSRAITEERHEFYRSRTKVSGSEQAQINLTQVATGLETAQGAAYTLAGVFAAIPDSKVGVVGPFPTAIADVKIGEALSKGANAAAAFLGTLASFTRGQASITGINAGYERRWDDWKLQERLAQKELVQLDQQLALAAIRLDIAEKELENHEQQLEQAEEMLEFLKDKFTSRELYGWMVQQLTRSYQQLYKLAHDAAKTAERTFEFELGVSNSAFIQFGYVDSLRQGLLAGEKLEIDLKRLDLAYLERNRRELEIQKPISLANLNGAELQKLRETGTCQFELPEVLFDLDYPGHYFRRIKAVRVTIPCVTGPHTSVSAKLSLLGSTYRKQGAADPEAYAYTGADDPRFVTDPIGIQAIATSRAQGDAGLFELNFRDERYLPFEGAGAVSRWQLELPTAFRQFDYHSISDVVVELSYTARDGGGLLKKGAEDAIAAGLNRLLAVATDAEQDQTGLVRVFSLKREFPDALHRLLSSPDSTPITLTLAPEHFPYPLKHARLALEVKPDDSPTPIANPVDAHVVAKPGASLAGALGLDTTTLKPLAVSGNVGRVTLSKGGSSELLHDWTPQDWVLRQSGLTQALVEDIVLAVKYVIPE